jgi:hypothetical protein
VLNVEGIKLGDLKKTAQRLKEERGKKNTTD